MIAIAATGMNFLLLFYFSCFSALYTIGWMSSLVLNRTYRARGNMNVYIAYKASTHLFMYTK
jgi:hypothetical protein